MGCAVVPSFDAYRNLSAVPAHRILRSSDLLEQLRKSVGFKHIAVSGLDIDGYHFGRGRSSETSFPPAYVEAYFAEELQHSDPLVIMSRRRKSPLTEVEAFDMMAAPVRLQHLHRSLDIQNRFLVPVSRDDCVYGGVCFTNDRPFTESERQLLAFLAEPLHKSVTKPLMDHFAASIFRLSEGEVHCLTLASKGLTSDEIAVVSEYQLETVNTYLKRATRKLGAANRTHAIAEAIRRQIIS
ncbi:MULTISPECIES: helix-turn-helix transcriptional regulator [Rhizobium]|uniref:LuxR family quorum sensing-dependent transcriptional regulator n=1 Tax=Rhizobium paranaense TaxID=1650438 RepID=A0A7W8XW12_9HYPH|nr:LuxR family transcriptional regulator [Rhizobium paranaense]MBB5576592.1 LuxR family quorum sensing-dependent transcriptional regulator [Rhizobium paranaense]